MTARGPSSVAAGRVAAAAAAAALTCALSALLHATPAVVRADCNRGSLAGRAAGGEILNRMLGGFDRVVEAAGGVSDGAFPLPGSAFADCTAPRTDPPARETEPIDPSPGGADGSHRPTPEHAGRLAGSPSSTRAR